MENLDELLASLEDSSPMAGANRSSMKQPAGYGHGPSQGGSRQVSVSVDFDIDQYLNELSSRDSSAGPTPNRLSVATNASRASELSLDEINDLLGETTPAQPKSRLRAAPAPREKSLSPADIDALFDIEPSQPVQRKNLGSQAMTIADIDRILESQSAPPKPKQPAPKQYLAPSRSQVSLDEVDVLLNELHSTPSDSRSSTASTASSISMAEVDALLESHGAPHPLPQQSRPHPPAASTGRSAVTSMTLDDIDALLEETGSTKYGSAPVVDNRSSLAPEDLDSLLGPSPPRAQQPKSVAQPKRPEPKRQQAQPRVSMNTIASLLDDTRISAQPHRDPRISTQAELDELMDDRPAPPAPQRNQLERLLAPKPAPKQDLERASAKPQLEDELDDLMGPSPAQQTNFGVNLKKTDPKPYPPKFEETEWKAGPHLLKKTGAQRAHEESDLEQDYVPESFDQVLKHAPTVAKQQPSAQKPPQKSDLEQQSELEELLGEEGELKQKYTRGLDADEALIARAEAAEEKARAERERQAAAEPELSELERESRDATKPFQDTFSDIEAKKKRAAEEERKRKLKEESKYREHMERRNLQLAESILQEEGGFSILDTVDMNKTYFPWNIQLRDVLMKEKLGIGDCGQTFRGFYKEQQVTVKKLRAPPLTEEFLAKFRAEIPNLTYSRPRSLLFALVRFAHTLYRVVCHPNVFLFLGVIITNDLYAVQEYVHGIPLYGYVRNRAVADDLDAKAILKWSRQLADGMAYLHANGIIHRSLKSKNIMVDREVNLKIRDYGLQTVKNWIVGQGPSSQPEYDAPELLAQQPFDDKIDVYSFSMLMIEMFAKESIYGKTLTAEEITEGVLTEGLRPQIPIDAPFLFIKLIESCWQTEPSLRPSFEKVVRILSQPAENILNWASA